MVYLIKYQEQLYHAVGENEAHSVLAKLFAKLCSLAMNQIKVTKLTEPHGQIAVWADVREVLNVDFSISVGPDEDDSKDTVGGKGE